MVGLPPSGYRITAHDGHLASCDGNKQALAPVGVPPRRFSAVSYLGAFCFRVVSSKPGKNATVPHSRGGVVLYVRQPDGDTGAHGGRLHPCGGPDHGWVGCEASQPFLRRFSCVSHALLPFFADTTLLKQNAPISETAEERLGDTPTGAIACLFPSQNTKCPSWAVIR